MHHIKNKKGLLIFVHPFLEERVWRIRKLIKIDHAYAFYVLDHIILLESRFVMFSDM